MRQTEIPQRPPDSAAMDLDAMRLCQFRCQFAECDLSLVGDARLNPAGHAGQFAVTTSVTLRSWCQ